MKTPRHTTRTLTLGLIAGGALLAATLAPAAMARGPQGPHARGGDRHARPMVQLDEATIAVARATGEQMTEVREGAFDAIRSVVKTGVETITALGENEAPAEAVEVAAGQSRDAVLGAVIDADAQIVAIANETIADLRANGASSQQIMAVLRVRDRSLQSLHQGAMRGQFAIGKATRIATGQVDEDRRPHEGRGERPDGRRHGLKHGEDGGDRPERPARGPGRRGPADL